MTLNTLPFLGKIFRMLAASTVAITLISELLSLSSEGKFYAENHFDRKR
jgi:hypothetical protein